MSKGQKNTNNLQQKRLGRSKPSFPIFLSRFQLVACFSAVLVIIVIVYFPVLSAGALFFDDDQYLSENYLVRNPSWDSASQFMVEVLHPSTVMGYYQPLTMISLMVDCAMGGDPDNLMPFHRTNLILHILNTGLIVVVLSLLFGKKWVALGVGLLFGLHPMTVETVAWICERKTLLSAFFAFWCLIFYILYSRNKNRKWYFACVISYLLALISKPISIPLPALMLLLDFWPLRRFKLRTVREKIPLFIIGAVFAAITVASQNRAAPVTIPIDYNIGRAPLILCHNIIHYFRNIIWPVNLRPYYAFPSTMTLANPKILFCVIATCLLIIVLILSMRWTRMLLTGWLLFFVAIFPAMGLIGFTNVIASDKYAYLPSIGLLMILTAFLCRIINTHKTSLVRYVLIGVILLTACAEAVAVRGYLTHWKNTVTLCEYIFKKVPQAPHVHLHLGSELVSLGRLQEAKEHFYRTLKVKPSYATAYYNLGVVSVLQGKPKEALDFFREAVKWDSRCVKAYNNLAWVMATSPDPDVRNPQEAIGFAEYAVKLSKHQNVDFLGTLAAAQACTGQFKKAAKTAQAAIELAAARKAYEQSKELRIQLESYLDRQPYYESIPKRH